MPANLLQIVESTTLSADEITARTKHIHSYVLSKSKYIDDPNFTSIHTDDIELLFTLYDEQFFTGTIKESLGTVPLHFSLSKRMTKSGGKTAHCIDRADGKEWYEIGVSTTLLFQCFAGDDHRPIRNSGIVCHDRLDALQRIMEHELVHLIEMLLWDKSSCAKPRFHSITLRFFGHTDELTHPDITIQTCWDSDRLDLGRVGIMPHPSRLCTAVAKRNETIHWADGRASFGVVPEFVSSEWEVEVGSD